MSRSSSTGARKREVNLERKRKNGFFVFSIISLSRFNGFDGRLDREMEAVIMVMEAFQGFENKIRYDIVGHSGESDCINFVDKKNPPIDNKQRLDVIRVNHLNLCTT